MSQIGIGQFTLLKAIAGAVRCTSGGRSASCCRFKKGCDTIAIWVLYKINSDILISLFPWPFMAPVAP